MEVADGIPVLMVDDLYYLKVCSCRCGCCKKELEGVKVEQDMTAIMAATENYASPSSSNNQVWHGWRDDTRLISNQRAWQPAAMLLRRHLTICNVSATLVQYLQRASMNRLYTRLAFFAGAYQ